MVSNVRMVGLLAVGVAVGFSACKFETSSVTGWDYNQPINGGFQKVPYEEQETGPGLILIEGGTFTMGRTEQDVTYEHHNSPRRVTVSSFYLDETEVTNFHWCEYLYWTARTYNTSFPLIYKQALPDTLIWREKLAYLEPYVENYLRHPAFRDYPVVGVSWLQCNAFCQWRTDRVNEYILIREGILEWYPAQQDEPFVTDAYLSNQYDKSLRNQEHQLVDLDPDNPGKGKRGKMKLGTRPVRVSDGILLPRYRLPTEAEWEFAAYGLVGQTFDERIVERRIYPWDGHWVRNPDEKWQGDMLANFVRGRGDYMGIAGNLNDAGDVTTPVFSYWPNDYGLYNMGGNVSEWVLDTYRPLSTEDFDEFRPFRGNVFKTKVLTSEGSIDQKHDETIYDIDGIKQYILEFEKQRRIHQRLDTTTPGGKIDQALIDTIKIEVDKALEIKNRYKDAKSVPVFRGEPEKEDYFLILASYTIKELIQTSIPNIVNNLRNDPNLGLSNPNVNAQYEVEIAPILIGGISEFVINEPGNVRWRDVTEEENINRRNYRKADNVDFLEGDIQSSKYYLNKVGMNRSKFVEDVNADKRTESHAMFQHGYENGVQQSGGPIITDSVTMAPTTLISDKSKVFKGGSWRDRAYWLNPGTRRYLDEDMSRATIGFRCAMDRVGSPIGLGSSSKRR